ncbi:hypothetical protein OFO87_33100, partial [Escherichia coli]|nr:hypothetical protein [Escherichia coli]
EFVEQQLQFLFGFETGMIARQRDPHRWSSDGKESPTAERQMVHHPMARSNARATRRIANETVLERKWAVIFPTLARAIEMR